MYVVLFQFKLSCSKIASVFKMMEVRNSRFAAFVDAFTANTYVCVVMSNPDISSKIMEINIGNSRKVFDELEKGEPRQAVVN